jgi:DNA-binding GntR family transcriptional regulator
MKQKLVHRTLSSAIAEQLRQGILSGTHAAGSQLRQDALAAQYGVSRIPVREALFQLEAEGLVQIAPHKGAIVSTFSRAEVDDVFDLRVLLEPRLLRHSAPLLTDADYADIAQLDAAFATAIAQQDIAHWGELNARFHQALYRHAPQPRTLAIVTQLLQTSERYTRVQMNRASALPRAEREHRKLLQLCRSGHVDAACAHLAHHIEAVRKDLHRLINPMAKVARSTPAKAPSARRRTTPA